MPARRYKFLSKENGQRLHREHRSKGGRKKHREKFGKIIEFKNKVVELHIESLEEDEPS